MVSSFTLVGRTPIEVSPLWEGYLVGVLWEDTCRRYIVWKDTYRRYSGRILIYRGALGGYLQGVLWKNTYRGYSGRILILTGDTKRMLPEGTLKNYRGTLGGYLQEVLWLLGYLQGVLWSFALVGRHVADVLHVQPLGFEVQVHVV